MTRLLCAVLAYALVAGPALTAAAQGRAPTPEMARTALDATSDQWIAFRNYNDRQWIYFTGIVTWHCALKQVRYSVNSDTLDQVFPLPECNVHTPYNIDPEKSPVYVTMKLGSAETIAVQLVFSDGTKSETNVYKPCNVDGDTTCGVPVKGTTQD